MFYTFNQNNSGGYHIQNEDVDSYVIIEGNTALDIINKAKRLFDGNDEYCKCCGERWDIEWLDEEDIIRKSTDEPMIFGEDAYKFDNPTFENEKLIIHYIDGNVECVDVGGNKKERDKDKYRFRLIRFIDTDSWGFEYGKSELKLPKEVSIEQIKDVARATRKGEQVMAIPYVKGIKVTYKNGIIKLIHGETKTEKAYSMINGLMDVVDTINLTKSSKGLDDKMGKYLITSVHIDKDYNIEVEFD